MPPSLPLPTPPLPTFPFPTLPLDLTLASSTHLASLWSDYGHIHRLILSPSSESESNSEPHTLILKTIRPPPLAHPSESHLRKMLSYAVERWFYHTLAARLPPQVKLARAYPLPDGDDDQAHSLLLEDLAPAFPFPAVNAGGLGREAAQCVLRWLAGFHGAYFGVHRHGGDAGAVPLPLVPPPNSWRDLYADGASTPVSGVWRRGTYYYLDTRREELADTDEQAYAWLLPWADKVDEAIHRAIAQHGMLVHGDVKGANILFDRDPRPHSRGQTATKTTTTPLRCALYDLQYTGLGLPALDLVYFLGTSVAPALLAPASERKLLQAYHAALLQALPQSDQDAYAFEVFWHHWELAIVDWCRFMAGWGFWGNAAWVERRAREVVREWKARGIEQL